MTELIRPFRVLDLVRLGLSPRVWAPNQVATLDRLGQPLAPPSPRQAPWVQAGLPRHGHCLRVLVEAGRPVGLAHGRARAGPLAWEVGHLHLAAGARAEGAGLLEELAAAAGHRGAHRLFLRLPVNSPVAPLARRSGFVPVCRETLLRRARPWARPEALEPADLFPRRAADDFDLFRLFLACAPPGVRHAWGLTLDEWRDARERAGAPAREWVFRPQGAPAPDGGAPGVQAWIQTWRRGGAGYLQLLVCPGEPATGALVDFALSALQGCAPLRCLSAEFQSGAGAALLAQGFEPVEEYQLWVKSVVAQVREVGFVPARV